MNQVLLFTLAFVLSQQRYPALNIAERIILQKGTCRTLQFQYLQTPPNTYLTFTVWNTTLLTVNQTVFLLDDLKWPPLSQTQICSINNTLKDQKTFITYYFTNEEYSYSNERNNTLIVYITEPRDNSQLNDVVWRNQNKKGNYAEFIVETPGDSGTLYYTISGLKQKQAQPWEVNQSSSQQQQYVVPAPDNLNSCRTFESECFMGGVLKINSFYYKTYLTDTDRLIRRENLMYGQKIKNFKTHISLDSDLIQATTYQICSFYRDSQSYKQSNISCFNFSTDSSQSYISVRFKFTSRISFIKLNAFLCFMVNYLGTHVWDVITSDGDSCSFLRLGRLIRPHNYFYHTNKYLRMIRFANQTVLYIYQHEKNHLLRSNYEQIWNFNQDLSMRFRGLLEQYNITWIKSGKNQGLKPISELLNTSKSIGLIYQATKTIQEAGQEQKNVIFNFSIISFQKVGAAHFVMVVFQDGIERQQFCTQLRIIKCSDPYSEYQINFYCYKFILTSIPQKPYYYEVNLTMPSKAVFKVLYYETNEYPKFPIVVKKVSQVQFKGQEKEQSKQEKKHQQKVQEKQQKNKTVVQEQAKSQQPKVKEKGTVFNISDFYLSIYLVLIYI